MRILSRTFLVAVIVLASPAVFAQGITGRVTSTSGEPLSGVTVTSPFTLDKATTDGNGAFLVKRLEKLKVTGRRLRFQMNGYRPVTRFLQEGSEVSIVMEKSTDAVWRPPICKLTPGWFRGENMAFRLPKQDGLTRGYDVDYGVVVVRYEKNALRVGYGLNWSGGVPVEPFFENIAELHERDIQSTRGVPAGEYRGKRIDGTYFRFIGMFGETVEYDHATKDQADYFDAIMDTLCWVRDARP